jgi:hypothetical protein
MRYVSLLLVSVVFAVAISFVVSRLGEAPTATERDCGRDVLDDWSDGRLDGTYSGPCYLAALDGMPEDLRAYTSARDDITRALQHSAMRESARIGGSRSGREP